MNPQDIQLLFKYNQWANARILNAAANVTNEQFLAPASYPHGGLRGTLTHTLSAELIWHKRWEGHSPTTRIKADDFPNFESMRAKWSAEENLLMDFIEQITDEKLYSVLEYKTTDGVPQSEMLWKLMAHLINHGTQHRSEAAALLTDLGYSPGDIDLIVFLREEQ